MTTEISLHQSPVCRPRHCGDLAIGCRHGDVAAPDDPSPGQDPSLTRRRTILDSATDPSWRARSVNSCTALPRPFGSELVLFSSVALGPGQSVSKP